MTQIGRVFQQYPAMKPVQGLPFQGVPQQYSPDQKWYGMPGQTTGGGGNENALANLNALTAQVNSLANQAQGLGYAYPGYPVEGGGAPVPSAVTVSAGRPEQFLKAHSGGIFVDKGGKPVGTIPEKSYVDLASGKLYGPDNKEIKTPKGATADLFDLPSIKELSTGYNDQLQMYNSSVAGTYGGGYTASIPVSYNYTPGVYGGGALASDAGAAALGNAPGLQSALASLIATLQQLAMAVSVQSGVSGGGGFGYAAPGKGEAPDKGYFPGQVGGVHGHGQHPGQMVGWGGGFPGQKPGQLPGQFPTQKPLQFEPLPHTDYITPRPSTTPRPTSSSGSAGETSGSSGGSVPPTSGSASE